MWKKAKDWLLDLFFPRFCLGCQREIDYLCADCQSVAGINNTHQQHSGLNLKDLYWAASYRNPLIESLIKKFKYEPFVKELAKNLSSLIVEHLQLIEKESSFSDFIIVPVPLEKKKLRWRGFNQSEEIGRYLADFLGIALVCDCLIKIKSTPAQAELSDEKRKSNVAGVFFVKNGEMLKNKKVILIDDVYTTGSTMDEAAKTLKKSGVKEIVGMAVARG